MPVQARAFPSPAIGDPVLFDGRRWRIVEVQQADDGPLARIRDDATWTFVRIGELRWDRIAGAWRVAAPETEAEARAAHGDS